MASPELPSSEITPPGEEVLSILDKYTQEDWIAGGRNIVVKVAMVNPRLSTEERLVIYCHSVVAARQSRLLTESQNTGDVKAERYSSFMKTTRRSSIRTAGAVTTLYGLGYLRNWLDQGHSARQAQYQDRLTQDIQRFGNRPKQEPTDDVLADLHANILATTDEYTTDEVNSRFAEAATYLGMITAFIISVIETRKLIAGIGSYYIVESGEGRNIKEWLNSQIQLIPPRYKHTRDILKRWTKP